IFPIESIYRWGGKIEKEKEYGMFLKTKKNLIAKIIKRVKKAKTKTKIVKKFLSQLIKDFERTEGKID
ncbi:MAG: divalent cation tolerance protein CutA, partial [Candidatus Sericytochromatia bacterium]